MKDWEIYRQHCGWKNLSPTSHFTLSIASPAKIVVDSIKYLPIFILLMNSTHYVVGRLTKSLQNFQLYLRHTTQMNIKIILTDENKVHQFSTGCVLLTSLRTSEISFLVPWVRMSKGLRAEQNHWKTYWTKRKKTSLL